MLVWASSTEPLLSTLKSWSNTTLKIMAVLGGIK